MEMRLLDALRTWKQLCAPQYQGKADMEAEAASENVCTDDDQEKRCFDASGARPEQAHNRVDGSHYSENS